MRALSFRTLCEALDLLMSYFWDLSTSDVPISLNVKGKNITATDKNTTIQGNNTANQSHVEVKIAISSWSSFSQQRKLNVVVAKLHFDPIDNIRKEHSISYTLWLIIDVLSHPLAPLARFY